MSAGTTEVKAADLKVGDHITEYSPNGKDWYDASYQVTENDGTQVRGTLVLADGTISGKPVNIISATASYMFKVCRGLPLLAEVAGTGELQVGDVVVGYNNRTRWIEPADVMGVPCHYELTRKSPDKVWYGRTVYSDGSKTGEAAVFNPHSTWKFRILARATAAKPKKDWNCKCATCGKDAYMGLNQLRDHDGGFENCVRPVAQKSARR